MRNNGYTFVTEGFRERKRHDLENQSIVDRIDEIVLTDNYVAWCQSGIYFVFDCAVVKSGVVIFSARELGVNEEESLISFSVSVRGCKHVEVEYKSWFSYSDFGRGCRHDRWGHENR